MIRQYSRRTVFALAASVVGAAAAAAMIGRRKPAAETMVLSGPTMGTTYRVTLARLPANIGAERADHAVRGALERVDTTMSTYRLESDVSRFNRAATDEWIPVSADTAMVAATAIGMAQRTAGAFDPTVGPLVDLWGFGPGGPSVRFPEAAAVAAKQKTVGYAGLDIRRDPPALRKRHDGLHIDLSGIAEGFAIDEIATALHRLGVADFLIELGGEIRCQGRHPAGRPWTVAIEMPRLAAAPSQRYLELTDAAAGTSGDYRKFFIIDGRRYSHIIDPRTGQPVDHGLASVTVIDRSAMQCDALSTALLVMGPEAGFDFAEHHQIAALFIARDESGFSERMTIPFARFSGEGSA